MSLMNLAAACAAGLVIGLERGWQLRDQREGGRVAGLRTFALTALFGGLLELLSTPPGHLHVFGGLLAVAALLARARGPDDGHHDRGMTTAMALLTAYALGALAGAGEPLLALGVATMVAVLLYTKPALHGWLRLIRPFELTAALQLLILSLVILPLLPDTGVGPYAAINPYRLWWMVVLLAALSLAGHLAMRITGPQRGLMLTGLLGALASSTAATLAISRRVREQAELVPVATAAILAACSIMFLRLLVVAALVQWTLLKGLALAFGVPGALLMLLAAVQWWRGEVSPDRIAAMDGAEPFGLAGILLFGGLLAASAVLVPLVVARAGSTGIYLLALVGGAGDVDPFALAVVHDLASARPGIDTELAIKALGLAGLSNTLVKAGIAMVVGGRRLGLQVAAGLALVGAVSAVALMV